MFFNKYPHPANFIFGSAIDPKTGDLMLGKRRFSVEVLAFEGGLRRIRLAEKGKRYPKTLTEFTPPSPLETRSGEDLAVAVEGIVQSREGAAFGVCGDAWMFPLQVPDGAQFFGLGEKTYGRMELSGVRSKFYNTDVWSDHHFAHWMEHPTDPPYFSTPYVVVRTEAGYAGILVSTPYPSFIQTPGREAERVFVEWQQTGPTLLVGAEGGQPDIWVIEGPTLREATRKLQKLVGVTPLPPLWALGYHQSKWGYAGEADLLNLDQKFDETGVPCDGLWLDIDYMRGFRVFTVDEEHFPHGIAATAKTLAKNGRRVVPILDPGVKAEKGFDVYDDGSAKCLFCRAPEGGEFIGLVWPGETTFPDFTQKKARAWWVDYTATLTRKGIGGYWVDMNDPSTGPVEPTAMLFNNGRDAHFAHRNEYALGMQMATREGLRKAKPNERPFVLSRSGFTGSSRYSAIWTGDNVANYFYLKMGIPSSVNLSLSGLPFNGMDLGGFGLDPTPKLMSDWFKAAFLFPFCRNHSAKGTIDREPWAFSGATRKAIERYIKLRYTFLPYLYNLFVDHETSGDPILRPLFYEFDDSGLEAIDDAFMVGPYVLQAPVVEKNATSRQICLPGDLPWFDASSGRWVSGAQEVRPGALETPLYLRAGAILPLAKSVTKRGIGSLREVDLHVFVPATGKGFSEAVYAADDGLTLSYRKGKRSSLAVRVEWSSDKVSIDCEQTADGYGAIHYRLFLHGGGSKVVVNGKPAEMKPASLVLTGKRLDCRQVV